MNIFCVDQTRNQIKFFNVIIIESYDIIKSFAQLQPAKNEQSAKITYCIFVFSCTFILLSRESDQNAMTSSLMSCRPPVYRTKTGESRSVSFPPAQQVNLPTCSPHCPFNAERKAGKLWILI